MRVDPAHMARNVVPPAVRIEEMRVNQAPVDLRALPSLAPASRDFEIRYTALTFTAPGRVRFKYRLEGFDKAWVDAGSRRVAYFTNLAPGSYRFRVKAANDDGVWNEEGAAVAFVLEPRFVQTGWFYGLCALGLVLTGAGSVRWRLRALRARTTELEGKVRERTAELDRRVAELARTNEDLLASHQRADRIFSALAEALPGTVLDRKYKLEERIGAGGFGVVFRATHLQLRQQIAVKVFKPSPGNDSAEAVERFRREAIAASRVKHPNAVSVLDSGISDEGIAYLAMELLAGESLAAPRARDGTLSLRACAAIVRAVCDALEVAHALGVVHRDMKPENVFLHREGEREVVKVVDFGIARWFDTEATEPVRLTETNAILGTPLFISPERLQGKPYDGRADVYSVGVMLYEMLSGHLPVESEEGPLALIALFAGAPPKALRAHAPRIPEAVEAVVMQCLAHDPAARPTAREMADALERALEGLPDDLLDAIHGAPPIAPLAETLSPGSRPAPRPPEPTESSQLDPEPS